MPNAKPSALPVTRRILRRPQVQELTGLPCSTMYRLMSNGTFPAAVELAPNTVGWHEHEILEWLTNLPRYADRKRRRPRKISAPAEVRTAEFSPDELALAATIARERRSAADSDA